ncbi:ectonucleotide pyrophosphatase/phosphodiesterase [Acidobacteria bacterium AH-259-O06]|nr:ectonucleotide pyrophosphatase/phosphodiesterase [Acidobacteria bacterium AH-259-O06]
MRFGHFGGFASVLWNAMVAFVLMLSLGCTGTQNRTRPDHVVLISIDGFRPDFYLDTTWPAPMIQQMAREGAHAEAVRGIFPSSTFPSHTTIVTGALPSHHGVYYNRPFEPEGKTGRWYWRGSLIRVPTLWNALRQAGRESASILWPVTVGAPIDRNIPQVWSPEPDVDPVTAIRSATVPPELFVEIEREATGKLTASDFTNRLTRDDRAGTIAAYLLEEYRPALLAVHLRATDYFQHQSGRKAPIVRDALAVADRVVRQIIEATKRAGIRRRTAFIVTGDHGFVDIHTRVAPNVWLVEGRLMEARDDLGDWRATFHAGGGAAFLHLRNPEDTKAVLEVRSLLARLPSHVQRLFRIIEREELERIGADPAVPLALSAVPGISFTSSPRTPVTRPTKGGTHGHFPDFPDVYTGFIGWGAGFRSGAVVPIIGLEDIAPLIAELLGIAFEAPDGVTPGGLLEVQD